MPHSLKIWIDASLESEGAPPKKLKTSLAPSSQYKTGKTPATGARDAQTPLKLGHVSSALGRRLTLADKTSPSHSATEANVNTTRPDTPITDIFAMASRVARSAVGAFDPLFRDRR